LHPKVNESFRLLGENFMKRIAALVGVLLSVVASSALAVSQTDNNRTITRIGTQAGLVYIAVSPGLTISGGCLYSLLYVDVSTTAGKSVYSTLLLSYTLGQPISRVDYSNSGSGQMCYIDLVEATP